MARTTKSPAVEETTTRKGGVGFKWPKKSTLKVTVACVMGVIIPSLTLVSSYYVGVYYQTTPVLAALFTISAITAMAVSVGHLAWSIQDTTPTPPRAAWATALLIDGLIALGEVASTTPEGDWKATVLIAVLWVVSVLLNIHAFLNHKPKVEKK